MPLSKSIRPTILLFSCLALFVISQKKRFGFDGKKWVGMLAAVCFFYLRSSKLLREEVRCRTPLPSFVETEKDRKQAKVVSGLTKLSYGLVHYRLYTAVDSTLSKKIEHTIANEGERENEEEKIADLSFLKNDTEYELVVIVHGFVGSSSYLRFIADFMANQSKNRIILTFDIYGRGHSVCPGVEHTPELFSTQIAELCFRLGIQCRFHLVGYSMGGIIVSKFARTYPEKLRSLTLVCTAGTKASASTGQLPFYLEYIVQTPVVNTIVAYILHLLKQSEGVKGKSGGWDDDKTSLFRFYKAEEERRLREEPGLWRTLLLSLRSMPIGEDSFQEANWQKLGVCIKLPKLLIMADKDIFCPGPESMQELKTSLGDIKTVLLEGFQHDVMIEHPKVVGQHIINFVELHNR
eukprot:g1238.t1